jgi:hypothetical protein
MYRTCIYCNRKLGSNETIERFPVGRRLAFDRQKGRLWVICETCRRWNLSPLEERWEAIDDCERRFYDTARRFSTDNIGLARLAEGLELVRIGQPRRREFAAWRYGRTFLRRRIRSLIVAGSKLAISAAGILAGADIFWVFIIGGKKRVVARVRDEKGTRLFVTRKELPRIELSGAESADSWSLLVPYRPLERAGLFGSKGKGSLQHAVLRGPVAVRAAGRILPMVNSWGGTNAQVQDAVTLIEESATPASLFVRVAGTPGTRRSGGGVDAGSIFLKGMRAEVRLALEMAAHEESERRALEGELAQLEDAWREAEEIASIADRLLVPEAVERRVRKWKDQLAGKATPVDDS